LIDKYETNATLLQQIYMYVPKQQFNILQYYIEHAARKYIQVYSFSLTILFVYLSLFIYQIETDLI